MKIEAGRRYMDTMGAITTPLRPFRAAYAKSLFSCEVYGMERSYTAEGKYSREGDHPYDLVAEYKEPAEEREIVGWQWDGDGDGEEYAICVGKNGAGADTLPLLNIFKPIRTINSKTPAKFLARADDGSYLFEIGDRYNVWRVNIDDVDDQFENVPDETRAVVRMYQNSEGAKFFVWGSDTRSPSALATCELTYSDEQGWQVRDLMTTKEDGK